MAHTYMPGAGVETMPGSGVETMPGAGVETMPGAGVETMPGAGVETMPGAGIETMPGAGIETMADPNTAESPESGAGICAARACSDIHASGFSATSTSHSSVES
jgi:hypothetical protein